MSALGATAPAGVHPVCATGTAPKKDLRLAALRRFALAITTLNVVGHFYLGFEQSWAQPLVALATAYSLELLLEWVSCRATGRRERFRGGFVPLVNFLLSPHISALAVSMLTYCNDRLWPVAFAAAVAIGSKYLFRVPVGNGSVHVFNPSNLGITATILAFPWVGIAAPYQFTENLASRGDWVIICIFITLGSLLNTVFTKRVPLILAWLGTFVLQGQIRQLVFDTPWQAPLMPMTGAAFLLFTFYMVTDPPTTPSSTRGQIAFGASVAAVYGLLLSLHVVFTLFFALTIVCAARGAFLWAKSRVPSTVPVPVGAEQVRA